MLVYFGEDFRNEAAGILAENIKDNLFPSCTEEQMELNLLTFRTSFFKKKFVEVVL